MNYTSITNEFNSIGQRMAISFPECRSKLLVTTKVYKLSNLNGGGLRQSQGVIAKELFCKVKKCHKYDSYIHLGHDYNLRIFSIFLKGFFNDSKVWIH